MRIAYFMLKSAQDQYVGNTELHEKYATVQKLHEDISRWTGLTVGELLHDVSEPEEGTRHSIQEMRSLAAHLALHDVLAEEGIMPEVVMGLSLGILSAACMAGSLAREDAFRLLWEKREVNNLPSAGSAQGVAMCRVAGGKTPEYYYENGRDGVYLAVDFGLLPDGSAQYLMLGGYKKALEELVAAEPDVMMLRAPRAAHTPLRQKESDFIRSYLMNCEFSDPRLPLITCQDQRTLTQAVQVRDAIWENQIMPASIPDGLAQLARHEVGFCLALGRPQVHKFMKFPVPIVRVAEPADVAGITGRIHRIKEPAV
jgi:[acyl-carrier-protein] S-malonyltransferase